MMQQAMMQQQGESSNLMQGPMMGNAFGPGKHSEPILIPCNLGI
jgi:hypothetical protein